MSKFLGDNMILSVTLDHEVTQTKFVEMPNADGVFTDEEELNYDDCLRLLEDFLENTTKVYLFGVRSGNSFFQVDRAELGKGISLIMIESSDASLMEYLDENDNNISDILTAFTAYWKLSQR